MSLYFSAAVARVFSTPAPSSKGFSFCHWVAAAFIPPVARIEFPPTIAWLSKITTDFPKSAAVIAEIIPAPPAPITTTSASRFWSFSGSALLLPPLGVLNLSVEKPISLIACSTPVRRAVLDTVAPAIPSTLKLCCSTIKAGRASTALLPIPWVSELLKTFTPYSLSASAVTSNVMSPPKPATVTFCVFAVSGASTFLACSVFQERIPKITAQRIPARITK